MLLLADNELKFENKLKCIKILILDIIVFLRKKKRFLISKISNIVSFKNFKISQIYY